MAFVNKKLSISEKKKISDMKIKNPYGSLVICTFAPDACAPAK